MATSLNQNHACIRHNICLFTEQLFQNLITQTLQLKPMSYWSLAGTDHQQNKSKMTHCSPLQKIPAAYCKNFTSTCFCLSTYDYIRKKRYTWWSKITWRWERQILLIQTGVGRVQSVYTCVFRHIKIKNILLLYIMWGCWKKKDDIMQNNCHLILPALS